jgi:BolA protein
MNDPTKAAVRPEATAVADAIRAKLGATFSPLTLDVSDESRKHAGHAHVLSRPGVAEGVGETHFKIKVVSRAFEGKSRIDRHRAVNAALADELAAGVHALSIDARAPGE